MCGCDSFTSSSSSDTDWVMVTTGTAHTCGLHSDGIVECWGCGGNLDFGQCSVPDGVYTFVDAGFFHTCALEEDGHLSCWGCEGTYLGINVNQGQCDPPGYANYAMIEVGAFSTCGVTPESTIECHGCKLNTGDYGQCWDEE